MQNLPKNTVIPFEFLDLIYWPNKRKMRLRGQRWEQTKGIYIYIQKSQTCKNYPKTKAFPLRDFNWDTQANWKISRSFLKRIEKILKEPKFIRHCIHHFQSIQLCQVIWLDGFLRESPALLSLTFFLLGWWCFPEKPLLLSHLDILTLRFESNFLVLHSSIWADSKELPNI